MTRPFALPDLGEGVHEAEIIRVLVSVGDTVVEDQAILEVETDKATVEIPSPYAGSVTEVAVQAGDIAKVGQLLVAFNDLVAVNTEAQPQMGAEAVGAPAGTQSPSGVMPPVPATPATRRLARELGVDLRQVPPSGPGSRVTAEDVRSFADAPASPLHKEDAAAEPILPAPDQQKPAPGVRLSAKEESPVERVPLRSIRRSMAHHMAAAWSQIPHVHHHDLADITELEGLRHKHKAAVEAQGGKLTLTTLVLKAVAAALKESPTLNCSFDAESDEIVYKHFYHIGVATDTDRGLIVPVIRDVDCKSVAQVAVELAALAERVRAGKVTPEDLRGGTFTVTNVGELGGLGATPIINHPEVAILALGAAAMRPVVQEDAGSAYQVVPRLTLPLTLGFDHRVIDGMTAARFTKRVIQWLENPERLLMGI